MKISKLFLACLLSGMVGNVYAESIAVLCKAGGYAWEIEFNDENPTKIMVDGRYTPYNYRESGQNVEGELIKFNSSIIAFKEVRDIPDSTQGRSDTMTHSIEINRKTGRFNLTEDLIYYTGGRFYNDEDVYSGECKKMDNNGF